MVLKHSLIQKLITCASIPILAILLIFNLRRMLFTFTILFISPRNKDPEKSPINLKDLPNVLVLVSCRNESKIIHGLCQAISQLDYPPEKHQVVLINDGSTDGTVERMEQQAEGKPGWNVLNLPNSIGKASALNAALKQFPFGEIVYIFDADHRPEPDSLKRAVRHFEDPQVAGVSGLTIPSNPLASPSAYYSMVENHVHRMITMRAKDRFDLAPALLGSNCGYRRTTLKECGGFRDGALLEDSDLTLAFYRAGYRVRFAEDAVARHQVPETIRGYLMQHIRWSRGFNDISNQHSIGLLRDRRLSLPHRIELFLFSVGYLDRIAMAGAAALTILAYLFEKTFRFPWQVLSLALLTPLAQILILFAEQRMPVGMWLRLPFIPVFYALDIFAAVKGMLDSLSRRRPTWEKTERSPKIE